MAVLVVTTSNLGNEFDLGVIEAGKIHIKVDGVTITRNIATGVLSVDPSAFQDIYLKEVTYAADYANPSASIPLDFNMSNGAQHQIKLEAIQDAFGVLEGYMVAA